MHVANVARDARRQLDFAHALCHRSQIIADSHYWLPLGLTVSVHPQLWLTLPLRLFLAMLSVFSSDIRLIPGGR